MLILNKTQFQKCTYISLYFFFGFVYYNLKFEKGIFFMKK